MAGVLDELTSLDRVVADLNVEGWCRPAERHLLYTLARSGPAEGAIVEIGSWKGLSTIYLAAGSKRAGRERVTAIDPFTHSLTDFHANILRAGVADWVDPVEGESASVARDWDGRPIRLLYIDGDHSYAAVRQDYESWQHRVVPGGVIVFHDVLEPCLPDVSRFLDEVLFDAHWTCQSVLFGEGPEARTTADSALMTCSMVVARKRTEPNGAASGAWTIGQRPFAAMRRMMTALRAQQLLIHQLEMADPIVARRIEHEREQFAALRRYTDTLEREVLQLEEAALERDETAEYARELESRISALEAVNQQLASTNQALDQALRTANPLKNRLRARLRRHR